MLGCVYSFAVVAFQILEDKYYDRMIQFNYESTRTTLIEIATFVRSKARIDFSIEDYPEVSVCATIPHGSGKSYLAVDSVNVKEKWLLDSLSLIGWTGKDLDHLCQLLQQANCRGVRYYGPPIEGFSQGMCITYRSNWWIGVWEYIVFPEMLTPDQLERKPIAYGRTVTILDRRIGWGSWN